MYTSSAPMFCQSMHCMDLVFTSPLVFTIALAHEDV